MRCPKCQSVDQNGNFCSECGYKLKCPVPTLDETIVLDKSDERACGMKLCPFHQWAKVTSQHPIDSICTLPMDGGNVLVCGPDPWSRRLKDVNPLQVERLPKCYSVRPLSDEFLEKHPEFTKEYLG